jgi:hypothetical protein
MLIEMVLCFLVDFCNGQALIELSIQQQQTLQQISTNLPARLPGNDCHVDLSGPRFCALSSPNKVVVFMVLITL